MTKRLPGLDCGSCGAPTCRALAEDIVRGEHQKRTVFIGSRMICSDYWRKRGRRKMTIQNLMDSGLFQVENAGVDEIER